MSAKRTHVYTLVLAVLSLLVLSGIALIAAPKDFTDSSKRWETAWNAGDAAGVAAIYTEDGVVLPPNHGAVEGRAAIEAFIKEDIAGADGGKLTIESIDSSSSGDLGYAHGTWAMKDADGNVLDTGKWVEVRKRVKGNWYTHVDIWNSDTAAASN